MGDRDAFAYGFSGWESWRPDVYGYVDNEKGERARRHPQCRCPVPCQKMMRRYQDFVRELASRDHDRSCPANEHCTCIVGEAADVVMGIKR